MSFVQILEFDTTRANEIETLLGEWRAETADRHSAKHEVMARNHTRPDHYVAIVEFRSWEDAQQSSRSSETVRFAEKMNDLCDGPVSYSDYDVIRDKN